MTRAMFVRLRSLRTHFVHATLDGSVTLCGRGTRQGVVVGGPPTCEACRSRLLEVEGRGS